MKVAHVLRKYNPTEWGGTESALLRLFNDLEPAGVENLVYCPRGPAVSAEDPLAASGCKIRRFKAYVPVWGISRALRQQMIAVGGNLMSFDLISAVWRERNLSLIHAHTLGRLGGIARSLARRRRIPCVVSIHGGVLDLPDQLKEQFKQPIKGLEWGKPFGLLLRSRRVLADADAIVTCNPREAERMREKFPGKRVHVQAHGVPIAIYSQDCRAQTEAAFPQLAGKPFLLCLGRIDPIKNQLWLVERMAGITIRHPDLRLVLAGACTDHNYGARVIQRLRELGIEQRVISTGGFSPTDPRLIGLLQRAIAIVVPSISETFGLVILESWAAGTAVISSRTSGASALIKHRQNGWLFDLESPQSFYSALEETLAYPNRRQQTAELGRQLAATEYDTKLVAARVRDLYQEVIESRNEARSFARR